MCKIIEFLRGGSPKPLKAERDIFDSCCTVFNEDGRTLYNTAYANSDFCYGYHGGILKEGEYQYICGYRKDKPGKKVLYIFDRKYADQVKSLDDLTEKMRVLPSLIPNPNHAGNRIITQVLIHSDSEKGGGSHGCMTIYPVYYQRFIDLFAVDESGLLRLTRSSAWEPGEIYKGAV